MTSKYVYIDFVFTFKQTLCIMIENYNVFSALEQSFILGIFRSSAMELPNKLFAKKL
jgi:hypothetical protein